MIPTRGKVTASGALFYTKETNRFLLLQKAYGRYASNWGLVGGTNLEHEDPWTGLQREIAEEIGFIPEIIKTIPLETYVSTDRIFSFYTYLCIIQHEFIPMLSDEHIGWCWATWDQFPKPIHQGLKSSLNNNIIRTKIQTIFEIIDLL